MIHPIVSREEIEKHADLMCIGAYKEYVEKQGFKTKSKAREDAFIKGFFYGVKAAVKLSSFFKKEEK